MTIQNKDKHIVPSAGFQRRPLGIYVHIPFCRQKCRYCDFVSFPAGSEDPDHHSSYIAALKQELKVKADRFSAQYQVDSVYIGGGTPTMLDVNRINKVVEEISRRFSIVGRDRLELTIEANPESIDELQCRRIRDGGFNRVSLGVQSLSDEMLQNLGRIHDSRMAEESFGRIREIVTDNINVDLMFGIPGQTPAIWDETLEKAKAWKPAHLSFYSLQLEEGTPFYQYYRSGKLELPSWEANRQMYHTAVKRLKKSGYEHYEVSSAALPGRRCLHNLKYWSMADYLGLGLASHSYLDGVRYENTSDLGLYIAGDHLKEISPGNRKERMGDYLFTALRQIRGFELVDFSDRFGVDFCSEYGAAAETLVREGLLICDDISLRFSAQGLDRTNLVLSRLLNHEGGPHGE